MWEGKGVGECGRVRVNEDMGRWRVREGEGEKEGEGE